MIPSKEKAAVFGGVGAVIAGPLGPIGAAAGLLAGEVAGYNLPDLPGGEGQIWFGMDPAQEQFGATRFKVNDGPLPFQDSDDPTPAHSDYFDEDPESERNIAKIIVGRGDEVERQEYR
jgi:hypothetical protein